MESCEILWDGWFWDAQLASPQQGQKQMTTVQITCIPDSFGFSIFGSFIAIIPDRGNQHKQGLFCQGCEMMCFCSWTHSGFGMPTVGTVTCTFHWLYFEYINKFCWLVPVVRNSYYCLLCLFIVAKDSSNPVFLKLVLQGLAADWKVDKDLLVANLKSSQGSAQPEPSTSNISHSSDDGVGKHVSSETQAPFQRSPSPALSPDLCYVSADSLSSFGELCILSFLVCLVQSVCWFWSFIKQLLHTLTYYMYSLT